MANPSEIVLTDNPETRARLTRKLEEYDARIASDSWRVTPHCLYKRAILSYLLDVGRANLVSLIAAAHKASDFDDAAFRDAFMVVYAYNADCTALLAGGTGLK